MTAIFMHIYQIVRHVRKCMMDNENQQENTRCKELIECIGRIDVAFNFSLGVWT